ncbi:MAG: TetR/AcrR family transcriptional regulator [Desulfonauticus sp.]|nr:TetR/AcrR family transcriptional regulator [Desulfonauticus sp.]
MSRSSKHLPAEERRKLIIETVIKLSAQQNPKNLTTEAIARHMNVTQGALFRHFSTKEAIIKATIGWIGEKLKDIIDVALNEKGSVLSILKNIFMAHVDFIVKHPGVPHLMLAELQRSETTETKRLVKSFFTYYKTHLYNLFEQGKTLGEFNPQINNEAAIVLFIGSIQGLVLQSLIVGDINYIRHNASKVFSIYQQSLRSAP